MKTLLLYEVINKIIHNSKKSTVCRKGVFNG